MPRSTLLAFLVLTTSAAASTWIVDDDGGAGVDFTTIQAAVTAASPGDTIVVRPGSYAGFVVSEGVSILGSSGATVTGAVHVVDVPVGPRVVVSSLALSSVLVRDCESVVILDALRIEDSAAIVYCDVLRCSDVRLRRSQILPGLAETWSTGVLVREARLEATESVIRGSSGYAGSVPDTAGEDGTTALVCGPGSDVHVSCTTVGGGFGGDGYVPQTHGGNGAPAIRVTHATARLLVTGRPSDRLVGGPGGVGTPAGTSSPAIVVSAGTARVSGVSFFTDWGVPQTVVTGGTLEQPSPADPCLSLPTATPPGQPVMLTLHGTPGAAARLRVGRQATVVDLPGVYEDRLTLPLRTYDLGVLPASGSATYPFLVPAGLADGFLAVFQGSVTDGSGTHLTQSVPVVIH